MGISTQSDRLLISYFTGEVNQWGFPDLDHNSDAVKSYIHQIQEYWLKDCHIDGLRYDAAKNIGYDKVNGVTYMAWDARNIQPHVFLVAEHVPEDPSLLKVSKVNALWHRSWHHTMVAQLTEHEYEGFNYEEDGSEIIVMVNFAGTEQGFKIELPRGGKYHEVLTNEDWILNEGTYQSTIPGSTARVLKRIG